MPSRAKQLAKEAPSKIRAFLKGEKQPPKSAPTAVEKTLNSIWRARRDATESLVETLRLADATDDARRFVALATGWHAGSLEDHLDGLEGHTARSYNVEALRDAYKLASGKEIE